MTAQEFAYWPQGFFELNECGGDAPKEITQAQAKMIRDHLQMVFTKRSDSQPFKWAEPWQGPDVVPGSPVFPTTARDFIFPLHIYRNGNES